jgi:hypothetical protein
MRGSVQHTAIGTPRKLTTAGPRLHVNECNRFSTVISAAKTDRRLGNAVSLFLDLAPGFRQMKLNITREDAAL